MAYFALPRSYFDCFALSTNGVLCEPRCAYMFYVGTYTVQTCFYVNTLCICRYVDTPYVGVLCKDTQCVRCLYFLLIIRSSQAVRHERVEGLVDP